MTEALWHRSREIGGKAMAMAMEVRTIVTTHNAGGEAVVKTVRRNCYSNRL